MLGDTEVWEIRNNTAATHPVHLHLVKFQVIGRTNRSGQPVTTEFDAGWKDTVRVNPGETVKVIATFDRAGEYVWHCHMLSHEDHDMMRPLTVLAPAAAEVVGRQVFYNNSAYDGRSAAADARDDGAVAADKEALLPMQTATFANVTSYTRGINGVLLDVRNVPGGVAPALSAADFAFKAGLTGDPAMWPDAPPPSGVTVRRGAGTDGSDRVTLTWPDGAIRNKWLRIQVLANGRTGLTSPDVFYFGNLSGETGTASVNGAFMVNAQDLRAVRARVVTRNVGINNRYDFNRDRVTNALDVAAVRATQLATLPVLTAPHEMGMMARVMTQSASFADGPLLPTSGPQASTNTAKSTTCACCGVAHGLLASC
jgi:hypothetical protein